MLFLFVNKYTFEFLIESEQKKKIVSILVTK